LEDRGDDTAVSLRLVAVDRTVSAFDRVDLALAVGLGLAVCAFTVEVLRFGAVRDLAMALAGLAAVRDFAAVVAGRDAGRDLLIEPADLVELADLIELPDRAAVRGLAAVRDFAAVVAGRDAVRALVPDFGLAIRRADEAALAAGIARADDMDLAAAVSDFAAVVMALVAVFIACMAVDIVLADDVALVAAAVILVAADVTLVAADETVRAAVAGDGEFLGAAFRVDLVARDVVLAFLFGRLAARLGALPLDGLVRRLAELRRAAVRVVVRAGTDLPPSRSITGVLFHAHPGSTHLPGVVSAEQWPQDDENPPLFPQVKPGYSRRTQPRRGGCAAVCARYYAVRTGRRGPRRHQAGVRPRRRRRPGDPGGPGPSWRPRTGRGSPTSARRTRCTPRATATGYACPARAQAADQDITANPFRIPAPKRLNERSLRQSALLPVRGG
jgi:hypothetical protein